MILDTIVERKKHEVNVLKKYGVELPAAYLEKNIDPPRGFIKSLVDYPGVALIAEAKKASPSKGVICDDFKPVEIANNYEKNGAQAISVLTDVDFFQGSLTYLLEVREAVTLPVLRKDFIIHELQIEEARIHGADAILLIATILDRYQINDYQAYASELGMDVLTEVHDEREAEIALHAGCELIGVNNRNLNDFSMDIETTFRLRQMIPDSTPMVSESGLKTVEDFSRLLDARIDAALVGETLMRAGAESDLLSTLRAKL